MKIYIHGLTNSTRPLAAIFMILLNQYIKNL